MRLFVYLLLSVTLVTAQTGYNDEFIELGDAHEPYIATPDNFERLLGMVCMNQHLTHALFVKISIRCVHFLSSGTIFIGFFYVCLRVLWPT